VPALRNITYVPLVGRPITVRELSLQVAYDDLVRREPGLETDPPAISFNTVEYARLQTYRMAVARGIYTDWPLSDGASPEHALIP
jgi:hypothetical protein